MRPTLLLAILVSSLCSKLGRAEPSSCQGCHIEATKRPAHIALLSKHADLACVSCHGGDAAEKEPAGAHVSAGPKALLPRVYTSASCVRCHLPGAVAGTAELGLGARAYQDLGCAYCHNISGYGSPEKWAVSLAQAGDRGPAYLSKMLNAPAEIFPGTRMPSFSNKWKDQPAREKALVTYLLSLRAEPRGRPRVSSTERCASCHEKGGTKQDRIAHHRCTELVESKADLSCARCHPKGAPVAERECLYVSQRQFDCKACHVGEGNEARSP